MDFDRAWPLLEQAAGIGDFLTEAEAREGLRDGSMSLFTRKDAAALTVSQWPVLRIGLGGGDLAELLEIEKEIHEYALQKGFQDMEILGRPGWLRALDGYDQIAVLMRKPV